MTSAVTKGPVSVSVPQRNRQEDSLSGGQAWAPGASLREGRPQDACDPRLPVAPGRPAGQRLPMGPVAINRRPLRLGAEKGRQLQAALRPEGQPWSLCGSAATATLPSGRKAGRSHSAEPPPRVVRRRSCTSPALRALAAGREEQGQPPPRVRGHLRLLPDPAGQCGAGPSAAACASHARVGVGDAAAAA